MPAAFNGYHSPLATIKSALLTINPSPFLLITKIIYSTAYSDRFSCISLPSKPPYFKAHFQIQTVPQARGKLQANKPPIRQVQTAKIPENTTNTNLNQNLSTMSAVEAPPPPAGRSRNRRGGRGGRGGNRGRGGANASTAAQQEPNPSASLALRPASIAPVQASTPANGNSNRGGNRGRGRGGMNRGGRRGAQPMMVNGRAFGGQLTSDIPASDGLSEGSLAADAPPFVPGQPVVPRARQVQARPRTRRMSKSQAPDIATRTHEDITNRQYECVICTNEVLPNSKIWGCKTCWSVLHLSCVQKWSKNEVSTLQQRAVENGELPPPRQWRCPGCNLPKQELPNTYTCWCAKETGKSILGTFLLIYSDIRQ